MLEKKQDSTNSKRDYQAGGYSFNNNLFYDRPEYSFHVGSSPTFSLFRFPIESGWGWLGVGQEPSPSTWLGNDGFQTIVSDGVIQAGSKFTFSSGTVSVQTHVFPFESPWSIDAPTTYAGKFLTNQYTEYHLATSESTVSGGITSVLFTKQTTRDTFFYVPYCEARVFRLLANVNGIQRVSGTQSRSFSSYWDVVFGIKNGYYCDQGASNSHTFSTIGTPGFLDHMSKTSFLSTGNLNLAVGATPSLRIIIPSPNPAVEGFKISVEINGTYSLIGSAKLTSVEIGTVITTWKVPT